MDIESLAPVVDSILEAAETRGGGGDRLSVSPHSFPDAVEAAAADGRVPVIAEIKPTSPTTTGERTEDSVVLAEQMVEGGATALSVLTEPSHFGGSPEALDRVREAVEVPVLRKDFILREEQLDTVAADMVLLIARFLNDLDRMVDAARERGFQVLVETHTATEVEAAIEAGADIVGVNNRDLTKLEVDLETFEEVAPTVPEDVLLVAESGIGSQRDVERMQAAGADALLVGSAIMDGDVTANTRRLVTTEGHDT
ncbi:indole-3-glycerol phosphate synthase [Halovenus salina]|uniref:Indole-3-glycerol phosphate synthase n=1 Tax=Halovenus salina TaxID=1510225 RepID=A0ABD5W6W3_9EURY|nr:indole-3-glycerol phosphate synthase [Halovenus salina]